MRLVVFGAGGAVGVRAVAEAVRRGHEVVAVERSWDGPVDNDLIRQTTADVLADPLEEIVDGADAVLSCLGVSNDLLTLLDPPPLYTRGTSRICDAMTARGVRRLLVVSASFVAAKDRGPLHFRLPAMPALSRIFDQMAEMEAMLARRDDIDWTAVRPGWLLDAEATGDYVVQADVIPEDMIRTRTGDLGHFMVELAERGDWLRGTPAIARKEPDEASDLSAVLKEMLS